MTNKTENTYFSGKKKSNYSLSETLKILQNSGAGEIFINSIDRDGSKKGYDLSLIKKVKSMINLPTIFCGGAGSVKDFLKVLPLNVSGVAAGNYFHFTEHSVIFLKNFLNQNFYKLIRKDKNTFSKYNTLDLNYRPAKLDDHYLENLKFKKVVKNDI